MNVFLTEAALGRVQPQLAALDLELRLAVLCPDGKIRLDGQPIAEGAVGPEVVWMSLDAFASHQLEPFFRLALTDPAVKWVQTFNAGLDSPLFRQIFDRGVKLSNSSAQAAAIAEYILAQVLSEWHPIRAQRAAQADHAWKRISFRELGQSHWLIVGYGHIGRETAKRAKAFGARVTGIRRRQEPDEFADAIHLLEDLPTLLPQADIVVLSTSLTGTTRRLADAAFLARLKPGAILVNVGRGGLVDEAALLKALDGDRPGLAILDVFETEPLPADSPFWDHPKVRLTAHCSPSSAGTVARGDALFLDNLGRFARGEPLRNEVTAATFG